MEDSLTASLNKWLVTPQDLMGMDPATFMGITPLWKGSDQVSYPLGLSISILLKSESDMFFYG